MMETDKEWLREKAIEIVGGMSTDFHREIVTGSEIAKWLDLPEEDLLDPVWTTVTNSESRPQINVSALSEGYEDAVYSDDVAEMVHRLILSCPTHNERVLAEYRASKIG